RGSLHEDCAGAEPKRYSRSETGIGRGLRSFLGFRKCGEDGSVELLTENWQVAGTAIQYRRRTRKFKWSKPRKKADEE
ncbi:MAG: hypothetical protein LUE98_05400, partial [Tannerellaceae bacterium]|nr:hypothetical protein [Tannerellaceae bacterium]